MAETGHWKLVYPEGTQQGVKRVSRNASLYLVMDGQEIKIPAVTGFALATDVHDADRITVQLIGTVEVSYDGPALEARESSSDAEMRNLIDAVKDAETPE